MIATVVAARLGDTDIAAHQIILSLWSLTAFALDAIAIAGQAIIGRYLGANDAKGRPAYRIGNEYGWLKWDADAKRSEVAEVGEATYAESYRFVDRGELPDAPASAAPSSTAPTAAAPATSGRCWPDPTSISQMVRRELSVMMSFELRTYAIVFPSGLI